MFLKSNNVYIVCTTIHKVQISNLYWAKWPETSYHNKSNQKEQQHSSPWLPNKKGKWQGDIFWAQKNFFCKVYSKSTQQILVKIASMAFHTLFASTKIISQNSLHCVVPEDIFTPTGFFLTLSPTHSESSNLAPYIALKFLDLQAPPPSKGNSNSFCANQHLWDYTYIKSTFLPETGWKNNINFTKYVSVKYLFTNICQFKHWNSIFLILEKPRQTIHIVLFNWVAQVTMQLLRFQFWFYYG